MYLNSPAGAVYIYNKYLFNYSDIANLPYEFDLPYAPHLARLHTR